jgi:hypothetical protein
MDARDVAEERSRLHLRTLDQHNDPRGDRLARRGLSRLASYTDKELAEWDARKAAEVAAEQARNKGILGRLGFDYYDWKKRRL